MHSRSAKSFVQEVAPLITSVFETSNTHNLRLLQLSLWDFERLYDELDERYLQNRIAIEHLTSLFFAISFEVKRGRLSEKDLTRRDDGIADAMRRHLSKDKAHVPSAMELACDQYAPAIDLRDQLLSNRVLVDSLLKGVINGEEIRRSLDSSRFFIQSTPQPAWLRMIHVLNLTEEEFEQTNAELEQSFIDQDIKTVGELLHTFSHRIWLAKNGFISANVSEATQQCIDYIDRAYREKKLPELDFDSGFTYTSYAGYGYNEGDSPEFRSVVAHLKERLTQAKTDNYPVEAFVLLSQLWENVEEFARQLYLTNPGSKVWNVPLLATVDPSNFVVRLLSISPAQQKTILGALAERYRPIHICENELAAEMPWLSSVKRELDAQAAVLPKFSRDRLSLLAKWYIDPVIGRNAVEENEEIAN